MTKMHLISVIIGLVTSLTVIGSATADTQGVSDNEVVIGTAEGVVRAYSVKRRAEGERWNKDLLMAVKG